MFMFMFISIKITPLFLHLHPHHQPQNSEHEPQNHKPRSNKPNHHFRNLPHKHRSKILFLLTRTQAGADGRGFSLPPSPATRRSGCVDQTGIVGTGRWSRSPRHHSHHRRTHHRRRAEIRRGWGGVLGERGGGSPVGGRNRGRGDGIRIWALSTWRRRRRVGIRRRSRAFRRLRPGLQRPVGGGGWNVALTFPCASLFCGLKMCFED